MSSSDGDELTDGALLPGEGNPSGEVPSSPPVFGTIVLRPPPLALKHWTKPHSQDDRSTQRSKILSQSLPSARMVRNSTEKGPEPKHNWFREYLSRTETDSTLTARNTSTVTEPKFTISYTAAEQAANHVLRKRNEIDATFASSRIQTSDYAVYVGFDESLVRKGITYLQQIHIYTTIHMDAITHEPLLSALGHVLSPFSSIIYTPFTSLRVPSSKGDNGIWVFDEFISRTATKIIERDSSDASISNFYPTVICAYQESYQSQAPTDDIGTSKSSANTSSASGSSASTPSEAKKDDKGNDQNKNNNSPPGKGSEGTGVSHISDSPDKLIKDIPTVSFKVEADVASTGTLFQRIKTEGTFTVQTGEVSGRKSCKITFSELVSDGAKTTVDGYQQDSLRVTIDSRKPACKINEVKPQQTLARAREEMFTSSSKVTKTSGASATVSLHGIPSLGTTMARAKEQGESSGRQQYTSRIHQHEFSGVVWWVFEIDDPYEREDGAKIQDEHRLPSAKLVYRNFQQTFVNKTTQPPEDIDIEVSSSWSCVPNFKYEKPAQDWANLMIERIKKLILKAHATDAIQFSNISQIITIAIPLNLSENVDYRATLQVDAALATETSIRVEEIEGPGQFSPHISSSFTSEHNDLETNSKLELPYFRKVRISPNLQTTAQTINENSGKILKVTQNRPKFIGSDVSAKKGKMRAKHDSITV